MSLLLDALKKAAEQKAQKSKSEAPENRSSDETLLDVGSVDETARFAVGEQARPGQSDETQLDQTELEERLSRGDRISGDDTSVDLSDSTQTQVEPDSRQTAAFDDTGIDIPDTTETLLQDEQPEPASIDDTGIDIPDTTETVIEPVQSDETVYDETGIDVPEVTETVLMQDEDDITGVDIPDVTETAQVQQPPQQPEVDETGIDIAEITETVHGDEPVKVADSDDATGVDITEAGAAQVISPGQQPRAGDDETILSGSNDVAELAGDDELDSRRPVAREDETDLNQLDGSDLGHLESGFEGEAEPGQSEDLSDDDTTSNAGAFADEDLSLILQEPDPTTTGVTTGFTDSRIPVDRARVPEPGDKELGLADITQDSHASEQTDTQGQTLTNPTATAIYGDDTLAPPTRSTITRADSTSTRTYAPDNYDRTLMKLPSDDASKLFAGMKPEADVVMTPDYAKKVFQSKTSSQQAQHYKYYAVIGIVILLSISIFGFTQYQGEYEEIETRLRALKRDPMPGIIKPVVTEETDLFAGADAPTPERTVAIIESANQIDSVANDEPEVMEAEVVEAEPVEIADSGTPEAENVSTDSSIVQSQLQQGTISDSTSAAQTEAPNNLKIRVSSQIQQSDIWLREAYEAYKSGDSSLAMTRYNQVLEIDPDNRNALLARAAINIQEGRIDSAIKDYQALLLANPTDSVAMSSLLGVGTYSPRETESQLKLMIREEPDSPHLNFALANAYGAQNRWLEAQGHYFTALQNNPGDPNYAYNLAVSLEHISQPGSAITYYQRALDNYQGGVATFSRDVVDQRLNVLGKK